MPHALSHKKSQSTVIPHQSHYKISNCIHNNMQHMKSGIDPVLDLLPVSRCPELHLEVYGPFLVGHLLAVPFREPEEPCRSVVDISPGKLENYIVTFTYQNVMTVIRL
eukprot:TRINITY_DN10976_c0_g2_i4.p2 TRINITY_DN10976_c0_g2~~TRINITY_DN10976_c0_g2_i4.p2  ORF type:complete len:108 (-),score=12.15 TRINITY_DN10976_c0_g2_i4:480-803(-)